MAPNNANCKKKSEILAFAGCAGPNRDNALQNKRLRKGRAAKYGTTGPTSHACCFAVVRLDLSLIPGNGLSR